MADAINQTIMQSYNHTILQSHAIIAIAWYTTLQLIDAIEFWEMSIINSIMNAFEYNMLQLYLFICVFELNSQISSYMEVVYVESTKQYQNSQFRNVVI